MRQLLAAVLLTALPFTASAVKPPEPPVTSSPIAELFIHPLIAYPDRAFTAGKDEIRMDEWFVTADEFERALESLEIRGYILVRASDCFLKTDTGWQVKAPPVPEGRKPLLLSMDDLNYYPYMKRNGTVSRLAVDQAGHLVARTFLKDGTFRDDGNREAPQILEAFVATHPDFSWHGGRGMIAVTGYNGLFGWPTHQTGTPAADEARTEAKKVAAALKAMGWEFASHSYAHRTKRGQKNPEWTVSEARWDAEVKPVIGPTPFYVFPFGENWWRDDERWDKMREDGFGVFFGVETLSNLRWKDGFPILGRVPLDGRGLRHRFGQLSPFLDSKQVWDPLRPANLKY